jgi:hypothetical protein
MPTKRWTRLQYDRLIECGVFQPGDRIELIGGELIVREPQRTPHSTAIELALDALRAAFGAGWRVRASFPSRWTTNRSRSRTSPWCRDLPGTICRATPSSPVLIVEAAESSLSLDREIKSSLYARAQIVDYWIVDLVDHVLEVYRDPVAAPHLPMAGATPRSRRCEAATS